MLAALIREFHSRMLAIGLAKGSSSSPSIFDSFTTTPAGAEHAASFPMALNIHHHARSRSSISVITKSGNAVFFLSTHLSITNLCPSLFFSSALQLLDPGPPHL